MMAFELPERHRTNVARWRRRVAGALVVSLVVMTTSPTALAADRTTHATLLQVNVADAAIVELPSNSKSKLLDVNEFEMRKAETVTIDIVDNNPLLFTYEADVTETETEQHKTAAEFAKVLAALMSGFKSGGGADGAILVEGLNFSALRGRLQALSMSMNGIGPQISKSLGTPADIESMKGTVRSWNISGLTSGLVDDLQKVAVIAGKCLAGSTLTTNTDITLTCTSALEDAEQPPDTLRKLRELREQSQKEAAARAAEQQMLAARDAAPRPSSDGARTGTWAEGHADQAAPPGKRSNRRAHPSSTVPQATAASK